MTDKDPLAQPQLRALQYWYVDGSYEVGFGLLCLILAGYFRLEQLAQGSWISALVDALMVLVFVGGAALINRVTRRWKERVIYPRTGYVAYPRRTGSQRGMRIALGLGVGALVGAAVAVLATRPFGRLDIMPLVTGLLMGLVLAVLSWRTGLPRLFLVALCSTGAGLGLAFARLGNYTALVAFYLILGAGLIVSGLVTLAVYMQRNPKPEEEK